MSSKYYKLIKRIRNSEEEKVDNDLKLYRTPKKNVRRDIQPSNFDEQYYHDYFDMSRPVTLHDDFVNFADYQGDYNYPWKKRATEQKIGYIKEDRSSEQPIFNEDLINELNLRKKSVIYSKRKK